MKDMTIANQWRARKVSLPYFITRENKILMGFVATALASFLYLGPNHVHLFTPQYLPMSWVDQVVPFIPHTVWIYVSDLFLFFSTYLIARDIETSNRYLYAFMALQTVSVTIFWLWPTTYPREMFPLPSDLDAATAAVFSHLRVTDSPANCLPSLHVSSCYLSAFVFWDEIKKGRFFFYFTWATLIALSTLTTKQHYLADVVTGFLFGLGFYWIFFRKMTYRWAESVQVVQAKR